MSPQGIRLSTLASADTQFPIPFSFGEGVVIGLQATCDKGCTVSGSLYKWLEDA